MGYKRARVILYKLVGSIVIKEKFMTAEYSKEKPKCWEASPCPFCGTIPSIEPWHGGSDTKVMIACADISCWVEPSVTAETKSAAIARWNLRA